MAITKVTDAQQKYRDAHAAVVQAQNELEAASDALSAAEAKSSAAAKRRGEAATALLNATVTSTQE